MHGVIEREREAGYDAYLGACVPMELREELVELARENFRTISGELRLAVVKHVAAARPPVGVTDSTQTAASQQERVGGSLVVGGPA